MHLKSNFTLAANDRFPPKMSVDTNDPKPTFSQVLRCGGCSTHCRPMLQEQNVMRAELTQRGTKLPRSHLNWISSPALGSAERRLGGPEMIGSFGWG